VVVGGCSGAKRGEWGGDTVGVVVVGAGSGSHISIKVGIWMGYEEERLTADINIHAVTIDLGVVAAI
jgi:hypothetical protein